MECIGTCEKRKSVNAAFVYIMICELCGCANIHNFHHLIPKTNHKNKWFKKNFTWEQMQEGLDICKECHDTIHDLIPDEKKLGKLYNTYDKLMGHEKLRGYVMWRRKKFNG